MGTPEYLTMMRLRKIWAEGSFSVLKREHCISRIRKRGILAATEECLLAAMALNLKRMVRLPLAYTLIHLFDWGLAAVWGAAIADWAVRAAISCHRFYHKKWMTQKV